MLSPKRWLTELLVGSTIIAVFLGSYALSEKHILSIATGLLGFTEQIPFFIFIPHGVRVVAIYLLRERAILPLLVSHFLLYDLFANMPPTWAYVPLALIGTLSAWLSFELLRWAHTSAYYISDQPKYRINRTGPPLLAGILAAIINGLLSFAILFNSDVKYGEIELLLGYIFGDILGLLVLLVLFFSLRYWVDNLRE